MNKNNNKMKNKKKLSNYIKYLGVRRQKKINRNQKNKNDAKHFSMTQIKQGK